MKKLFLVLGISLLVLVGCKTQTNKTTTTEEEEFSFAFLTDIHLQPERSAETGFQWAIREVNKLQPDFVITGGDLVMDVLNQTYGRADSLYKLYKEVSGHLEMPVYNTVGNHEVYGWHRDEEGIEEHPEFGKKMFEKEIGERFYSFDHKGWHFIILDANWGTAKKRLLIEKATDKLLELGSITVRTLRKEYQFQTELLKNSSFSSVDGWVLADGAAKNF